MVTLKTQNLQRSDWSESPPVPASQYFNGKNQIISRPNSVYPADGRQYSSNDQPQRTLKKQCKPLRCWSSTPPLARGLLLGVLVGCSVLAIILPLWLTTRSTPRTSNVVPVLRWNPAGITVAGLVGNPGNADNQLNISVDVILTYANDLYIVDRYNERIQKYLFNTTIGRTVAGNGTLGSSSCQLYSPSRVLIDSNENLYISDTYNHRIQFWNKGATNGTTIAGITGSSGNTNNHLNGPYGIALHPTSGTLYIADYWNNRIVSYPSGVKNGTVVFGDNGPGTNNTQLYTPIGLYYDLLSDSLVIANYRAHNIVRYALGASSWTLVAGDIDGNWGTNSTSLNSPTDMTFDPMGNLYVADRNNHRIQFFSDGGVIATTIAGITSVHGSNATTLNFPWAVRLDSQLNMYVADASNHRIQKFLRY